MMYLSLLFNLQKLSEVITSNVEVGNRDKFAFSVHITRLVENRLLMLLQDIVLSMMLMEKRNAL